MEWEKIFANDTTDKGLIANIFKELILLLLLSCFSRVQLCETP